MKTIKLEKDEMITLSYLGRVMTVEACGGFGPEDNTAVLRVNGMESEFGIVTLTHYGTGSHEMTLHLMDPREGAK